MAGAQGRVKPRIRCKSLRHCCGSCPGEVPPKADIDMDAVSKMRMVLHTQDFPPWSDLDTWLRWVMVFFALATGQVVLTDGMIFVEPWAGLQRLHLLDPEVMAAMAPRNFVKKKGMEPIYLSHTQEGVFSLISWF